ncbi:MAG: DNA mismatch repair endonuclease MutL, partial [Myxococcota bacterium]
MEQRRISVLDDATVDQIAAGEVVERPASVVKELVENALDAGATRVQVDVREGGIAWIGVTDNGHGMSPEDARLSLQRHATSKLGSASDLQQITSFGFRGEALPSIASVSRFRLVTRTEHALEGCEIRASGGQVEPVRAVGAPVGTRVEVADLFAQVPARRKFLKKASTEWRHIADWLVRLALVLPNVHFEIRRDDRKAQIWPPAKAVLDRIAAVLSEEEAAALIAAAGEGEAGALRAFVSAPEWTRPNTASIHLFVNGRPVRDRLIRHALLQSYRDLLPRGRFPSALLYLTLDPARVDVNVHPAKWEVRFSDPQAIHQLVRRTVRDAMEQRSWLGLSSRPDPGLPGNRPDRVFDRAADPSGTDWVLAQPSLEPPPDA